MRKKLATSKRMPPVEAVKADMSAGMTAVQMAEAYGVAPGTIKAFIRDHKLSQRRFVKYPPDEEIIAGIEQGESNRSMSTRFGISCYALWRRIHDRRLREKAKPTPVEKPIVVGPQPSRIKVVITTQDGSRISLPRIPTIHGRYEVRT